MTEHERALLREYAAVMAADLRVRLGDGPVTAGDLKRAVLESAATLEPPYEATIIVERDPHDATRINALIPIRLFEGIARRAEP